MNLKLLIDGIVRQTTVLIAQLSTTAGVRAPLAHLADQVFLSLAREIEAQGVGRKVVADMFGMALRSYQRKTQRLATSSTSQGQTLFEAVLAFVESQGTASRQQVLRRFTTDGERETVGILTDLVQSGLLHSTGAEDGTLYGITSQAERQHFTRQVSTVGLANMTLGEIYRSPGIHSEALAMSLGVEKLALEATLTGLMEEGRVVPSQNGGFHANTFHVALGSENGWESAVFDQFQAFAAAIINKIRLRTRRSKAADRVGGTTLRFELHADHPQLEEVLNVLTKVREDTEMLWLRVARYNDAHPIPPEQRASAVFYFGLNVDDLSLVDPEWSEE